MLEDYLRKERKGFLDKQTRFVHSGRRDRLPASLVQLIEEVEEETKNQTVFTLHLAVDYGGKDEIIRAMQKLKNPKDATDDIIASHLDHPDLPDIDLIVRTSGESRTSNFFLWQTTYSEWYFEEKLFLDFTKEDLEEIVRDFSERNRRFGA